VGSVLFAMLAVLLHFQSIFQNLFVFAGIIVGALANRALHLDHVVLGHKTIVESL
jgi:hypothetical protein